MRPARRDASGPARDRTGRAVASVMTDQTCPTIPPLLQKEMFKRLEKKLKNVG